MTTALIKLTQGATVGGNGEALKGATGTAVQVSNSDNTGVGSWEILLLEVAYGSALVPGSLASGDGATPLASFTPDASGGCYRVQLTVWPQAARQGTPDVDIRNFGINGSNGICVPPAMVWPLPLPDPRTGRAGAKPNEMNFAGQDDGWAGSGNDGLLRHALRLIGAASVSDIAPVKYCATGNIPLTGVVVVDGATPANGDRILAPFQTIATANGVYIYNTAGAWTRATDFDAPVEFRPGVFFVIQSGALYAGQVATYIGPVAPTLGVTALQFTVTQNADPIIQQFYAEHYGSGDDGDITFNAGNAPFNITETKYYRNVTVAAGADVRINGNPVQNNHLIFISGTLDLQNAPTGWLKNNGNPGGNAGSGTVQTAGTGGVGTQSHEIGGNSSGGAGGAGGTAAGTGGFSGQGGMNGGASNQAGAGGAGSGGAGGAGATGTDPVAAGNYIRIRQWARQVAGYVLSAFAIVTGGAGAPGGGGGGGNGATPGGGGGGGGCSGGCFKIMARNVLTGSNVNTGLFQAKGGAGGVGATATNANTGGGGGGSGGPGGFGEFWYGTKSGVTIANAFDLSGAAGANGGDGNGTGVGGAGGAGGDGGRMLIGQIGSGLPPSESKGGAGTAGGAAVGTAHGAGGAGAVFQVAL